MKKRTLAVLLAAVLAASVFTGCGNMVEGDGKVQAAVTDAESGQNESGSSSEAGTGESGTAESEPETTTELSPESTAEPESSAVPEPETSEGNESGQVEAGMGTAVGYTFTEMKETMYAKSQVNVRSLPSTDGEKVGKLTSGQEVKATGQCAETGWYRIVFEDGTAYVSDGYIVSEKPSTQAANRGNGGTASNSSETTQGTTGSQGQGQQTQTSTTRNEASSAFIDYLNQQRAAAGLSQVSWDSGLAEAAKTRSVEISTNFNHDNATNRHENILGSTTSDVSSWYSQWYNSDVHRTAMMDPNLTSAAAAFYEVDGYYWVTFLAYYQVPVQSAEEWNETKDDPNSGYHQMESTDNGDGWNSYGTEGVSTEAPEGEDWSWTEDFNWG